MSEGYLIINSTAENKTEVDILIASIKRIDPSRAISVVTNDKTISFIEADEIIFLEEQNPTLSYFKSLLLSPYTKTISFLPDQILTMFDTNIWENLRSLNSIVIPKNKFLFNNEIINPNMYTTSSTELKSFEIESIPNAIYFNKDKGCDDVFGLAVILSANYDQDAYIDFFVDKEHSMPPLPKFIWPSWILSMLRLTTDEKIYAFDFIHCIDLSIQENNYINNNWTKRWSEFLTYWVNEQGVIKIENFVQHGLIKYESDAWLTKDTLKNLKLNDAIFK
jgi:hypothetical protein